MKGLKCQERKKIRKTKFWPNARIEEIKGKRERERERLQEEEEEEGEKMNDVLTRLYLLRAPAN